MAKYRKSLGITKTPIDPESDVYIYQDEDDNRKYYIEIVYPWGEHSYDTIGEPINWWQAVNRAKRLKVYYEPADYKIDFPQIGEKVWKFRATKRTYEEYLKYLYGSVSLGLEEEEHYARMAREAEIESLYSGEQGIFE